MPSGGYRPGSGRKPQGERARTALITFRVSEKTKARFRRLKAQGYDVNAAIDDLAESVWKDLGDD